MTITVYKCLRCGHEWPSKQGHPTICPKCKSPYWDKESKASKWYVSVNQPEHPRANKQGRVRRAVLVLENKLGRFLEPFEEPHHINGVIIDDRPDNLEVTTHSEHARMHMLYAYSHNLRNTKGRPFYGNQYRRLTAKAV